MDRKNRISLGPQPLLLISIVLLAAFAFASGVVHSEEDPTNPSTEPIAYIGHGVPFDSNGRPIQVKTAFIEEAQRYYRDALLEQADEQQRALFEKEQKRLFDGQQWDRRSELYANFALIEWLIEEVKPADAPTLLGKLNLLKQTLVSPGFQVDPTKGNENPGPYEPPSALSELFQEADAASSGNALLAFPPSSSGGADYTRVCKAAGVPIPPDWGDFAAGKWVDQGPLSAAEIFITPIAEVYTYQSVNPEGVCFALPRFRNLDADPENEISLLGIICLGKVSSNACFWDNQEDSDGDGIFERSFKIEVGEAVPFSRFAGGADLATANAGGVCTDCHAGENPYIRHPNSSLGPPALSGLPVFADSWQRPLVSPEWPQNNGPTHILDSVPSEGMCTSCHNAGTGSGITRGGRFPELSLEIFSYCNTILGQAITRTMPPGSPGDTLYQPHVNALLNACNQAATRTDIGIVLSDLPDPVNAGEDLTYSLTVTNHGPNPANAVHVIDPLPEGLTLVSAASSLGSCTETDGVVFCEPGALGSGASATISIVANVDPTTANGTMLENTAMVSSNLSDTSPGNNLAAVNTTVLAVADLVTFKTDSPDPVIAGSNVTYTVTVTNNGPSDASGVIATDSLPAGVTFVSATPSQGSCTEAGGVVTCDLGDLGSGASATITIVVTIDPAAPGGTISNTASVAGNETDPNTADNTAIEGTTVIGLADLSITKSDSPDPVTAGSSLTFTLNVTNNGPGGSTGMIVTDTLPPGVTFSSATPDQGTCVEAGGVVTCALGDLSSGASASITIAVTIDPAAPGGTITNTANVNGNEVDPNTANNTISENTTVRFLAPIDVRPNNRSNTINPRSRAQVPVAILSTPGFDAPRDVDRTSLTFGRIGNEVSLASCNSRARDVNRDGMEDLICNFHIPLTGFQVGDTDGILRGEMVTGLLFEGRDSVRIVLPRPKR